MTHTYALLEVPKPVYDLIRAKLVEAGYQHAFDKKTDGSEVIDMHGIALQAEAIAPTERVPPENWERAKAFADMMVANGIELMTLEEVEQFGNRMMRAQFCRDCRGVTWHIEGVCKWSDMHRPGAAS